jgi:hypothetical protein
VQQKMMELHGKIFVSIVQVVRICQEECTDYTTLNFWSHCSRQAQFFHSFKQQSSEGDQDFPAVRQSGVFTVKGT